jgi:hypothetical protein
MAPPTEGPAVCRQCDAAGIGTAVTTFKRKLLRVGNQIGVWMYRACDCRAASYNKGGKILMIITLDRTGILHSTRVR